MAHLIPVNPATKDMFSMPAFNQMIEIVVGQEKIQKKVLVPKTLLCSTSDFFATACKGPWEGGREGKIHLKVKKILNPATRSAIIDKASAARKDVQPRIFVIFLTLLYTQPGNVRNMEDLAATPPTRMDADPAAKERWFAAQWSLLLQSWVLGDFLQAPQFQNHISDLMVANFENSTAENSNMLVAANSRAIKQIWDRTRKDSGPRRITLDALFAKLQPHTMRTMFEKNAVPQEFMIDLCEEGLGFQQNGGYSQAPSMDNSCRYHVHTDLVPKGGYCNRNW